MILVSTIHNIILSRLDAEGSDRYTFDQTTKYAINSAQDDIITCLNTAFSEKKLAPEALRELTKVKVWQTNSYSRMAFNATVVGHKMWTIIAVFPKPSTSRKFVSASNDDTQESKYLPNVTFVDAGKAAKRLTMEEWTETNYNAFTPGNSILKGSLMEFSYLDFADYSSTSYNPGIDKVEISIKPALKKQLVALSYLKYPNTITNLSDQIEFPPSLTEIIVEIALSKIAEKQGDQTNLWGITERNINRLVGLLM